jgi:hypothetical protein
VHDLKLQSSLLVRATERNTQVALSSDHCKGKAGEVELSMIYGRHSEKGSLIRLSDCNFTR